MAISFITASTGANDTTGPFTATGSAPGAAGRIIILQIFQDGATAGSVTFTSATNIVDLAGTANQWTAMVEWTVGNPTTGRHYLWVGRSTGTSAPTFTGGNSSGEDVYFRMYEFHGASKGTTLGTVFDGGITTPASATSTTVADQGRTTTGPNRLALNFIAFDDDLTGFDGSFTGETGGDWTRAASYGTSTGTDGALNLNIAQMPSAGTINGGTFTITSMGWGVIGCSLIPDESIYNKIVQVKQAVNRASTY